METEMTSEDRATLTAKERDALNPSDFAYVDDNGEGHLPIHDEAHVKAALGRFNQTELPAGAKKGAAKKILAAAKKFGIDVSDDSNVAQAARSRFRTKSLAERRAALHGGYQRRSFTLTPGAAMSLVAELRSATPAGDGTDSNVIPVKGYAIRYGTPYDVNDRFGTFSEEMRAGACKDTLTAGAEDPVFMYDHNSLVLGRRSAGTLRLNEDPKGLAIECDLDKRQSLANDLAIAIDRGDVHQMSVGFVVPDGGDEWNSTGTVRKINRLQLHDVSAVGIPASPTTSISIADDESEGRSALAQMLDEHLEERAKSFGNLHGALDASLKAEHPDGWPQLLDFDKKSAVFHCAGGDCCDGGTQQQGYEQDGDDVNLTGDPVHVRPVTNYVPLPTDEAEEAEELRQRQIQRLAIRQRKAKLRLSV
jgi:HK97 family phage prohead protease